MSYYLKYRPQKVSELDLTVARMALERVLKSGEYSHAYLFAGPKGTGKTSSARILAKVLNCEHNHKILTSNKKTTLKEPCGECHHCRTIKEGTSMSVIEMDAASNRGIDDIRQLKERISLTPADGLFIIYVIDEVHMLTTEAFNALLKTLEEPPGHAVFALCTTEAHKIPDTVVSRCTRVVFKKADTDEIVHSLKKAVAGEKLKLEANVLENIARRVDGSFRDGMKLLEQLAQDGHKLTLAALDDLTGYTDEYDPDPFIQSLLAADVTKSLQLIKQKDDTGIDFGIFGKRLVENLRRRLVDQTLASPADQGTVLRLANLSNRLSKAALEVKTAVIPSLPFELAAVEWCLETNAINNQPSTQPSEPSHATPVKKSQTIKERPTKKAAINKRPVPAQVLKQSSSVATTDFTQIKTRWEEILAAVKPHNHSLEALLKAAQPLTCEGDFVHIEVFYSFHKEQLEQDRHRRTLEEVMSGVLDSPVKLRFFLGKKPKINPKDKKVIENVSGSLEDEALAKAAEEIFS